MTPASRRSILASTRPAPPASHPHRPPDDFSAGQSTPRDVAARYARRLRSLARKNTFLRLLGAALMIYGAVGLAATIYAHGLVRDAFAGARQIGSVSDEKTQAVRSLQSISATLGDAATASANLKSSFQESQTSLETASGVATDVAVAFRQVAQAASFQVFGYAPLANVAQPFQDSSQRLEDLAQDLTRSSVALSANANDAQRLSADFTRLKAEVDDLTRTVSRLPANPTGGDGAQRLETALNAMLVWIGLQALAALFAGLALALAPLGRR